jgi:hypothetical protein
MDHGIGESMEDQLCYEWGTLFASGWDEIVEQMNAKAEEAGLVQESGDDYLVWSKDGTPQVRYVFVNDPSDIGAIRRVYNDDANLRARVCFIVVRQPDPSDDRGDIIFDIFRLNHQSYLWHFNRVFTPRGS